MSHKAVAVALRTACPSLASKLVLWVLADHHNDRWGLCFPSQERMAAMAGLTKRSVQRAVAELEAAGLISKRKGRRRGTVGLGSYHYRLDFYIQVRLAERKTRINGYAVDSVSSEPGILPSVSTPKGSETEGARKRKARDQRRRPLRLMVENWKPTPQQRKVAIEKGLEADRVDDVAEHFCLHWISKGEVKANWGAAWYIWVRRELQFKEAADGRARNSGAGSRSGNRGDDLERLHRAVMAQAEERRRREGGD